MQGWLLAVAIERIAQGAGFGVVWGCGLGRVLLEASIGWNQRLKIEMGGTRNDRRRFPSGMTNKE